MLRHKWSALLIKFLIWFISEVFLTMYGLDNLADYSEYLFEYRTPRIAIQTMEIR